MDKIIDGMILQCGGCGAWNSMDRKTCGNCGGKISVPVNNNSTE